MTPIETAEEVLRDHKCSEIATPDDAVDEFCSRCYLWDEPWPCAAVVLATAVLAESPAFSAGGVRADEAQRLRPRPRVARRGRP